MSRHRQHHHNPIQDTFKLVAETRRQVLAITEAAKEVVKKRYQDPAELVAYIESHGTPVYLLGDAMKATCVHGASMLHGFEPGFIAVPQDPLQRKRYDTFIKLLVMAYGEKPGLNTEHGVFVIPQSMFKVGFIAHQLHHWLSFKAGLPGYTPMALEEFRKFMGVRKGVIGDELNEMSVEQIQSLRTAIHREIEALQFIKNVTEEIFRPMHQYKQFSEGLTNA